MMDRKDYDRVNDLLNNIKLVVEKQINADYTAYKEKCLQDLDVTLERKRNECVKSVLDGIDIMISADNPQSLEPTIMVKVQKVIKVGDTGC